MAKGPVPASAWRLGLSDTLVRGNQSKAEDYSSSHQSPACSQRGSQSAQASGQRIHQRGQCLTSRKMSSTLHMSGQIRAQCHRLALRERSTFERDKRDRKRASSIFFSFSLRFDSWPHMLPFLNQATEPVHMCVPVSHSDLHRSHPLIQVEEMKGKVIRLKMINAPFCPSWHLEHICPSGTRTDMVPASGIKLPFAPSPETAGKGSISVAGTLPPQNHPQGKAAWAHLGAQHIRLRWYLWCGNGLLFIQRTEDVEMIHRSLSDPLPPSILFFSQIFFYSDLVSSSLSYSLAHLSGFPFSIFWNVPSALKILQIYFICTDWADSQVVLWLKK